LNQQNGSGADLAIGRNGLVHITIPANSWVAYAQDLPASPLLSFLNIANGVYISSDPFEISVNTQADVRRVYVRIDGCRWRRMHKKNGNWAFIWSGFKPGSHCIEAKAVKRRFRHSEVISVKVVCNNVPAGNSYTLKFLTENKSYHSKLKVSVNNKRVPLFRGGYVLITGKRQYTVNVTQKIGNIRQGSIIFTDPGRDNQFTVENIVLLENDVPLDRWNAPFDPNRSGTSYSYDLDKVRPDVSIVFPPESFEWTATNLKVKIKSANVDDQVSLVVNGAPEQSCAYEDGYFVYEITGMSNISYTVRAIVVDKYGNRGESTERNFTCNASQEKYYLVFEGYDWNVPDEVSIFVNGQSVAWEAPGEIEPKQNWVTFNIDITEQVENHNNGCISFQDSYNYYRNYIKNIQLSGPGVVKAPGRKIMKWIFLNMVSVTDTKSKNRIL